MDQNKADEQPDDLPTDEGREASGQMGLEQEDEAGEDAPETDEEPEA